MYNARIVGVRQHISYQRARCGSERAHGASALPSRPDGSDARGSCGDASSVLYADAGASLADLREAVQMLEETERTARRVLGGAHPFTAGIASSLQTARAILGARESGREVKIIRE